MLRGDRFAVCYGVGLVILWLASVGWYIKITFLPKDAPPEPPQAFVNFTPDKFQIISDYDFTNQNFSYENVRDFVRSFSNNKLSDHEINWIFICAHGYNVSAWVILGELQKESSLVGNLAGLNYGVRKGRAMGYLCDTVGTNAEGYGIGKYHDFYLQVILGTETLREWFDYWTNVRGQPIKTYSEEGQIVPSNAATYALYRYTPFFGKAFIYGKNSFGNKRFIFIWREYLEKRRAMGIAGR